MLAVFKKIFRFYVISNLHVAVAIACFVLVMGKINHHLIWKEAMLAGGGTFNLYFVLRWLNKKKLPINHLQLKEIDKSFYLITFFNGIILLLNVSLFLKLTSNQQYLLFYLVVFTMLYALPIVKWKREFLALRFIPSLKIYFIALVWSGVVVLVPFYDIISFVLLIKEMLVVFLFTITLTIPFDIRDVHKDNASLKTIPQLVGEVGAKRIAFLILLMAIILYIFFELDYLGTFIGVGLLLSFLVWNTTQKYLYTAFWVESVPIVWYFALLI